MKQSKLIFFVLVALLIGVLSAGFGQITRIVWSAVQNKPTTVAGYGITDTVTVSGALANNFNLNSLTTPARQYTLTGGNTYSNTPLSTGATPLNASAYGSLEVVSGGSSKVFQRLAFFDGTYRNYFRRDYNGISWSPWVSLVDSATFAGSNLVYRSGMYVANCQQTGGFTPSNDVLYLSPFYISRITPITAIQSRIIAAMGTGSTYRVGLYDSDSNGLPANPLEVSTSTTANTVAINNYNFSTTRTLYPAVYWAAFVVTGASVTTNAVQGCTLMTTIMPIGSIGSSRGGFSLSLSSGAAFPTSPSTSITFGGNSPLVGYLMQ